MNVVAEAIIVEQSHDLGFESAGRFLGMFWTLMYICIAVFGLLGGYLLEIMPTRSVFLVCR